MYRLRVVALIAVVYCVAFSFGALWSWAAEEKINVNQAAQADFYVLPGMTETLAKAIVDYRTKAGRFETLADLLKVPGMTREYLDQISSRIVIVPEEDEIRLPKY